KVTGGAIVRAEKGETGIDEVARGLKKMMREELAERVEIAFDEEYMWPLGLAVVLLFVEGLVPEAPLPRISFGFVGGLAAPSRMAPGGGPPKKKTARKKKEKEKDRSKKDRAKPPRSERGRVAT